MKYVKLFEEFIRENFDDEDDEEFDSHITDHPSAATITLLHSLEWRMMDDKLRKAEEEDQDDDDDRMHLEDFNSAPFMGYISDGVKDIKNQELENDTKTKKYTVTNVIKCVFIAYEADFDDTFRIIIRTPEEEIVTNAESLEIVQSLALKWAGIQGAVPLPLAGSDEGDEHSLRRYPLNVPLAIKEVGRNMPQIAKDLEREMRRLGFKGYMHDEVQIHKTLLMFTRMRGELEYMAQIDLLSMNNATYSGELEVQRREKTGNPFLAYDVPNSMRTKDGDSKNPQAESVYLDKLRLQEFKDLSIRQIAVAAAKKVDAVYREFANSTGGTDSSAFKLKDDQVH